MGLMHKVVSHTSCLRSFETYQMIILTKSQFATVQESPECFENKLKVDFNLFFDLF